MSNAAGKQSSHCTLRNFAFALQTYIRIFLVGFVHPDSTVNLTFDLPLIDTIDTCFDVIKENSYILFGPCMVCVINAINQVESCE